MNKEALSVLEHAGLKPTPNRVLTLSALLTSDSPKSMIELEAELKTLQKSSIFRVLTLFQEHGIVHSVEDGRGITKYEICHGEHHCSIDDMHPHFYCEKCERVFCFDNITTPRVEIPDSFLVKSVNYMLKGVCPDCQKGE